MAACEPAQGCLQIAAMRKSAMYAGDLLSHCLVLASKNRIFLNDRHSCGLEDSAEM